MKKINVLLFSICILGLSLYGLFTNSYYVQILINVSTPFIYARLAIVVALLLYVFVPSIRLNLTRTLLSTSGALMSAIGLTSLFSPSLMGYSDNYILIGDSLILIEAGILAIVLSAELSSYRSQFMEKNLLYLRLLFNDSLKDVS